MQKSYEQQGLYGDVVTVDLRIDNVPKGVNVSAEVVDETINGAIERLLTTLSFDNYFTRVRSANEHPALKIARAGGHEEDDLMIMTLRGATMISGGSDPRIASAVLGRFVSDLAELLVEYVRQAKIDAREPITQQLQVLAPAQLSIFA